MGPDMEDAPSAAHTTDVRTASAAAPTTHAATETVMAAMDVDVVDAAPVDALAVVDAPPVDAVDAPAALAVTPPVDAPLTDATPPVDASDVPPADAAPSDAVDTPSDAVDSTTSKSWLNRVFSLVHRYFVTLNFL